MNKFVFDIENNIYDPKDLTGTKTYITVCTNKEYEPNRNEFNIDKLTINDICEKYLVNKYYCAGDTPDQKVVELCFIPTLFIIKNTSVKGYLLITNRYGSLSVGIYALNNMSYTSFKYTIYDNPIDAGKEYIYNLFNTKTSQSEELINSILNWDNKKDDIILEEKTKLEEKYKKQIEQELDIFIKGKETQYKINKDILNRNIKLLNKQLQLATKFDTDLSDYNKILELWKQNNLQD